MDRRHDLHSGALLGDFNSKGEQSDTLHEWPNQKKTTNELRLIIGILFSMSML